MEAACQTVLRTTNVYLLAENRLVRETLARVLKKRAGISVVGVQSATESAIDEIVANGCEVVLTDSMKVFRNSRFLAYQTTQTPGFRVVLFGMDDDANTFWQAATYGVHGYLLKDASAFEIFRAVKAVTLGEAVCPPRLCMTLIQRVAQRSRAEAAEGSNAEARSSLTNRQMQMVELVAKGMTNKEIAANLNLSEFTVKNHIHRIMRQVDAENRHHAVEMIRAQQQI